MTNKDFIIVFQPKDPDTYGKRRFCIGVKSLHKYIGSSNANKVFLRALKCKDDKCTLRFRRYGRIDFYLK